MIGYNPSHLNKNETLLEAFHRVEAYLKANPQYQVYQSSATYQEGTQEYALGTIVVPEGSTVGKGDVVLFSNVYYAVITAVSETTFSIETATNFRGVQGEQGQKGDTGATGATGATGLPALMYSKNVIMGPYQSFSTDIDGYNRTPQINDSCLYVSSNTDSIVFGIIDEIRPDTQQVFVRKESFVETRGPQGEQGQKGENGKDGNATLLYSGELSESITAVEAAQITRPKNRGILVKDILISTAASTFGAMAQVTALPVGVTTVDVSFIGTLESGGGGSGVSDYNNLDNIPVINQNLTASGFTPVANTYYRHTGTTTDTFTQGVIYLYDTAYHKLGESGGGGGTTLNKYTYSNNSMLDSSNTNISSVVARLIKIVCLSKGKISIRFHIPNSSSMLDEFNTFFTIKEDSESKKVVIFTLMRLNPALTMTQYNLSYINKQGSYDTSYTANMSDNNGTPFMSFSNTSKLLPFDIIYYNDTEIT